MAHDLRERASAMLLATAKIGNDFSHSRRCEVAVEAIQYGERRRAWWRCSDSAFPVGRNPPSPLEDLQGQIWESVGAL